MKIFFFKAETGKGLLDAVSVSIATFEIELMLKAAIALEYRWIAGRILHLDFELAQFNSKVNQFFKSNQAAAPKCALGFEAGFLWKVANAQPAGAKNRAFGWFVFACQNAQQGGFAHTVAAHNGNAGVVGDGDADPLKNIHRSKRATKVL